MRLEKLFIKKNYSQDFVIIFAYANKRITIKVF